MSMLAWVAVSNVAQAKNVHTFSVFDSPTLDRTIHGQQRGIDWSDQAPYLGYTDSFAGMDALSDGKSRYLTSGMRWRNDHGQPLNLSLEAMNTAAQGGQTGHQTLMQAKLNLLSRDLWYLPNLTMEMDQLAAASTGSPYGGGQALNFGFGKHFDQGQYHLGLFQTDQGYSPWGGVLPPGQQGLELSGSVMPGDYWNIKNTFIVRRQDQVSGYGRHIFDKWQVGGSQTRNGIRPWRVTGQYGAVADDWTTAKPPLMVEASPTTQKWNQWAVDSAVGWYQGSVDTPASIPVDGLLWRLSMRRNFNLLGLETSFAPRMAVGGSQHAGPMGSRAGVTVGLPGLLDHVSLDMDYLSQGWSSSEPGGDMRVMLRIMLNTSSLAPWASPSGGW